MKGLLRKQYGIHVNDPIDQENGDGLKFAGMIKIIEQEAAKHAL